MFLLNVFGKSYVFSAQRLAQKKGASFLMKNVVSHYISDAQQLNAFNEAYNQENYNECISIWNSYINESNKYYGSAHYKMNINEIEVDQSL